MSLGVAMPGPWVAFVDGQTDVEVEIWDVIEAKVLGTEYDVGNLA